MADLLAHESPKTGGGLADDAYIAWFIAETECERALQAWFQAPPPDRRAAYAAYGRALDREEAAAGELREICKRGGDLATARTGGAA
jgi:hypothetical protein